MTDMDKETEAALRESIKHWEENVAAQDPKEVGVLASDCALCIKFFDFGACNGCPVAKRTGLARCNGTPFEEAFDAEAYWWKNPSSAEAKATFKSAAQAELDFLKSLLPTPPEAEA